MKEKLEIFKQSLKDVFLRPKYVGLAFLIAIFLIQLIIWLPNGPLFKYLVLGDKLSVWQKFGTIYDSFGMLKTNFSLWGRVSIILIGVLSGLNLAMTIFYIKAQHKITKSSGVSLIGTIIGMLGVGCTACGSVILTTFFSISFTTSALGFFPFHGLEITIFGLLLLLYSLWNVAQKISKVGQCEIKKIL